jgi:hypothetical protein
VDTLGGMPAPIRSLLPLLALVLALAACGSDDEPAATAPAATTPPTASAPEATAPPADATQPGTTSVPRPEAEGRPGGSPGTDPDAGGEQAVRVPASFVVVAPGRLEPPSITVPAFLAVEISVRSDDGRAHRLVLETPTPHTLDVRAGERAAARIPGLRAGAYPVTLDGRVAGTLVAGGEVGP